MSTPPNTTARSGVCFAYACTFAATWSASSRVGVRISTHRVARRRRARVACGSRRWMIGSETRGLAGTRLRGAHDVAAGEHDRNGLPDRRRRRIALLRNGFQDIGGGRIDRRLRRRAWRQNRTWWRFAQKARRGHRASGQPGLRSSPEIDGARRAARRRSGAWDRFNVNAGRQAADSVRANAGGKGRIVALRGHLPVTTRRTATTAVRATGPGRPARQTDALIGLARWASG